MKKKTLIGVGKRKKSVARAAISAGSGIVRINSMPLHLVEPKYRQLRIREPLLIAKDIAAEADISVNVAGGGMWGQADASRTAIGNALIKFAGAAKGRELKRVFIDYDRSIVISDSRRTEPHKPSRSKDGPRASKQQSKR